MQNAKCRNVRADQFCILHSQFCIPEGELVPEAGFEPATPRSTIWCSNQLSYPGTSSRMIHAEGGGENAAVSAMNFVRSAEIQRGDGWPFTMPALRGVDTIELRRPVTFFIGENGSGKSTLLESIAVAAGFNLEGGSKNFQFETTRRETELPRLVRLIRSARRPSDGYFLRAESFFNVASEIDRLGVTRGYGGGSLHERSHGEAFMALLLHRFLGDGFYILDEPEAALSPTRQLSMVARLH